MQDGRSNSGAQPHMEELAVIAHRLLVILLGGDGRRPILGSHTNCSPCLLLKTIEFSPAMFSVQSGQIVVNCNTEALLQSCIELLGGNEVRRMERRSIYRRVCPSIVKLRWEVNKEESTIIFHNVPVILDLQKKDFVKAMQLQLPEGTYLLRCGKEHRRMISDTRITEPCLVSLRFKINSFLRVTCIPLSISCLQQVKEKSVVKEAVRIFPTRLAHNPNHTIFSLFRMLTATDHDISEEDLAFLCSPTFRSEHIYRPRPTPIFCVDTKRSSLSLPHIKTTQYWEFLIGLCENVGYPKSDPSSHENVPVTPPCKPVVQVRGPSIVVKRLQALVLPSRHPSTYSCFVQFSSGNLLSLDMVRKGLNLSKKGVVMEVTIYVGLAAKRLRATVNLGSNKKKALLDVDQGEGVDQGWGLDQDNSGYADDAVAVCTEKQRVEDVFGNELPDFEVESEDCLESLIDDPFLSSSAADEITIVDEDEAEISTLGVRTLDENENPPNSKQVIEKEKYNELRMKEIERMRLLEEVKKRVGRD